MHIDYYISNKDLANVHSDSMELRYQSFLGGLTFYHAEKSIDLRWDWIPLFDFAISLLDILKCLTHKKATKEEFDFTDSDAKIFFELKKKSLKITTSISNEHIETDIRDFERAVKDFCKSLGSDILDINDKVISNHSIRSFLDQINTFK